MSLNSAALCTANHHTHDVRLVCQVFLSLQVSIHTPVLYFMAHYSSDYTLACSLTACIQLFIF